MTTDNNAPADDGHKAKLALADAQLRIRELEDGLRPFSDMAGEMFARNWNASDVAIALDNPDDPHRVTAGDFFNARALIERNSKSHCNARFPFGRIRTLTGKGGE